MIWYKINILILFFISTSLVFASSDFMKKKNQMYILVEKLKEKKYIGALEKDLLDKEIANLKESDWDRLKEKMNKLSINLENSQELIQKALKKSKERSPASLNHPTSGPVSQESYQDLKNATEKVNRIIIPN